MACYVYRVVFNIFRCIYLKFSYWNPDSIGTKLKEEVLLLLVYIARFHSFLSSWLITVVFS